MRPLFALAAAALLVGCTPDIPEGVYVCATTEDCPPDFTCSGGRCWSEPRDAGEGIDAAVTDAGDASATDAGPIDAGPLDATMGVDSPDACLPDRLEANEDSAAAGDGGSASVGGTYTLDDLSLHSPTDEDWIAIDVTAGSAISGDEIGVQLTLSGIPAGSDYDLEAYFECGGIGSGTVSCTNGEPGAPVFDGGCTARTRGEDDERVGLRIDCGPVLPRGTLYMHVESVSWGPACPPPYVISLALDRA